MRTLELAIDVTGVTRLPGPAQIAASVFLPDGALADLPVAVFASPGGGYGRRYYDLRFEGHAGYSQAEHHTARGLILIAYDHLGCGESMAAHLAELTIEDFSAANDAAVREILARLKSGTLADGLAPLPGIVAIGHGQSMGGGVTIIMQGRHASFDAIAPVGYSAIHTVLPQRTEAERRQGVEGHAFSRQTKGGEMSLETASARVSDFVYPFHWEDVPEDILAADMQGGYPVRKLCPPWGSPTIPNCVIAMMSPGYVREEAAAITVPVLMGFGERDVSQNMRAEPGAFPASRDVSVFIAPKMAHMHNFASTRRLLWDRIADWSLMAARAKTARDSV